MSAFVYANGQYHSLAGNKIVKDGALLPMKATDKIIVNGTAYNLGLAAGGENSAIGNRFDNGTEPASGAKWYITPDGAGNMDGTSWNNAAAGSQIHAILLSCASGDSVYIAEGEYTTDRIIDLPDDVTLFGGFTASEPLWATRNGFIHQSVFNGNSSFSFSAGSDGIVDGLVIKNYNNTGSSQYKNCIANIYFYGLAYNCIAANVKGYNSVFRQDATNCIAVNCSISNNCIYSQNAANCIAVNCCSNNLSSIQFGIFGSEIYPATYKNCIAVNCTSNYRGSSSIRSCIFDLTESNAINCTAVNCAVVNNNINSSAYVFFNTRTCKNCLSWNNNCYQEFSNTGAMPYCAGSVYNSYLAFTLGTDNSIARFTNTGFAPAQGVQDVGDCPSPINDPDGYAEWIAAFGDWHPMSNSFLLGAGTYDSSVTTDLDGTTRPNPPAIGAYEAVSA